MELIQLGRSKGKFSSRGSLNRSKSRDNLRGCLLAILSKDRCLLLLHQDKFSLGNRLLPVKDCHPNPKLCSSRRLSLNPVRRHSIRLSHRRHGHHSHNLQDLQGTP